MDKLFIIVPAYNESDNINKLVDDWYPIVEKYSGDGESRLVIINDGSKDNTFEILTELAESRPMLVPLTKENGGHGSTVLYGYHYAIECGADYIFQTDSDGQTNPAEFDGFWKNREKYSAIIGNRSNRQDGFSRVMVEKVLLLILRVIYGVKMPDSNAPFRLMNRDVLQKYIGRLPQDYNLPNVMLTTFFVYFRENIQFVEISFKPRQGGVNSINVKKIIKIGWKALGDFFRLKKQMKCELNA